MSAETRPVGSDEWREGVRRALRLAANQVDLMATGDLMAALQARSDALTAESELLGAVIAVARNPDGDPPADSVRTSGDV